MVDALAADWGVECTDDAKTVWFELGERPPGWHFAAGKAPHEVPSVTVCLRRPPMHLLPATLEYGEAVLREMALMALTGKLTDELPNRWRVPALDLGPVMDALRDAGDEEPTELVVNLAPDAAVAALERLAIVGLGDRLARTRRLLMPPPLPEVGQCRYWFLTEIAAQAGGGEPTAWSWPELGEAIPLGEPFPHVESLGEASTAVVVSDDTNRIIYASPSGLEVLGWDRSLVGQRLTVIIPPELREQHLAGFARVAMTGAPRVLGTPLRLPALRRDGSRVTVDLVLGILGASGGRNVYTGELRQVARGSVPGVDPGSPADR